MSLTVVAALFPYAGNPAAAAISISAAGLFVVIDEPRQHRPATHAGATLEGEGHFVEAIVLVRGESTSPQKVQNRLSPAATQA